MKLPLFLVLLALGICGCALFGQTTNPDGTVSQDPGGGIVGRVFSFAGLPWVTTALAGIGGVVAQLRGKKWKAAANATFTAIEEFKATPEGAKIWEKLKAKLGTTQADAKIREFVDKALEKL